MLTLTISLICRRLLVLLWQWLFQIYLKKTVLLKCQTIVFPSAITLKKKNKFAKKRGKPKAITFHQTVYNAARIYV